MPWLQGIPATPMEEEDERGQHHAEHVEMGGRKRREELAIGFPEFVGTKKVPLPPCADP